MCYGILMFVKNRQSHTLVITVSVSSSVSTVYTLTRPVVYIA